MKPRNICSFLILLFIISVSIQAQDRLMTIRQKLFDPNNQEVLVVSHRGDWRNACENSIEAIENAIAMGVDIVEIDLARTKDGHLILMHDDRVDRTTTGKGLVENLTLEEIKQLNLRNGCNIKTIYKVPTLEEALLTAKGRIMLNLDKAFDYFDQVYELLEKTGTENLVIMKSNAPAVEVKREYGKYLHKVVFMPKVDLDDPEALKKLNDYLSVLNPPAIEFKFAYDSNLLPFKVKDLMKGRSRIWYNTLWNTHAGGHDDDCSLKNPDNGYGYLINKLGATILQTDRPQYLIDYLRHHKKFEFEIMNWEYLDKENEFDIPENTGKIEILDCFLKGKKNAQANEDGIFVNEHFVAVIDGATAKSDLKIDNKSTGRLATELVIDAIKEFPDSIKMEAAISAITKRIYDFYVEHNLLDEIQKNPAKRLTANGVIYSSYRKEIWQVGDCRCLAGSVYSLGEKEIDRIMSEARAAFNEIMILDGYPEDSLLVNDLGRNFIKPFLEKQSLLQNNPGKGLQYAFPVFDGFAIQPELVNVFHVNGSDEIVLTSDGYPEVFGTLKESEQYLYNILKSDPYCIRFYKSTKGIQKGNVSFDDRAYIRIKDNN